MDKEQRRIVCEVHNYNIKTEDGLIRYFSQRVLNIFMSALLK